MAEQILKTMAAELHGAPGTNGKGTKHLEKYLEMLRLSSDEYHLENGSGLSRTSRISANALVRVLEDAWNDPAVQPEFVSSLALGGLDGTLEERRLKIDGKEVNVRAKTGSLRGVSCISGYLTKKNGEVLAFSILMNDLTVGYGGAHSLQDKIIDAAGES
jgi:D-alanyl-D-alanine carboxypeptidase/D-alanyl-D-alanine-endopeptidase (penicillin-binding protein 4)